MTAWIELTRELYRLHWFLALYPIGVGVFGLAIKRFKWISATAR